MKNSPFVSEKLIRDNIINIAIKEGKDLSYRIASSNEILRLLKNKIVEESLEYKKSGNLEELADILEVFYTILNTINVTFEEIDNLRLKKKENMGGFSSIVLEVYK